MKNGLKLLLLFLITSLPLWLFSQKGKVQQEYYRMTVYRYKTSGQEKILDEYLQNALIPALHKMKIIHVGVFKAIANDTSSQKKIFVLVPFKSLNLLDDLHKILKTDKTYQAAADAYINAPYKAAAYDRMEHILLRAFSLAPKIALPKLEAPKNERVYELRSYESPSEKLFNNKVHMFNEGGEIEIFKTLNFNAIFYGEVLAGNQMPNLMYMTSFEDRQDRDDHWNTFRTNAAWVKLSAMDFYKNNVSRSEIIFLRPTSYSDY